MKENMKEIAINPMNFSGHGNDTENVLTLPINLSV